MSSPGWIAVLGCGLAFWASGAALGSHLRFAEAPLFATPGSPEPAAPSATWEAARDHEQKGEVFRHSGQLSAALDEFRAAVVIMQQLVAMHPENDLWKRDLSLSEDKVGDVLLAQGSFKDAEDERR